MPWGVETEERESDIRAIIVTLETGFFEFEWVKIYDKNGKERYAFAEGEDVYFNCVICNRRAVTDVVAFKVTDEDTGGIITSAGFSIYGGTCVEYELTRLEKMPAKDWRLKFSVSP